MSESISTMMSALQKQLDDLKKEVESLKPQEVPLGVPLESFVHGNFWDNYSFCFSSEESKFAFSVMLNDYVRALQKTSKGEPIDITVLMPLLKKGYVAMDKSGNWNWYSGMPIKDYTFWRAGYKNTGSALYAFNIKPAENWETSLMECGI